MYVRPVRRSSHGGVNYEVGPLILSDVKRCRDVVNDAWGCGGRGTPVGCRVHESFPKADNTCFVLVVEYKQELSICRQYIAPILLVVSMGTSGMSPTPLNHGVNDVDSNMRM